MELQWQRLIGRALKMGFHQFLVTGVLLVAFCCEASTGDHRITNLPKVQCPGGWFFYSSYCYGFARDHLSWQDAELDCQSYGNSAHLASIRSSMEGILLISLLTAYPWKENIWVGLHDPEKNNTWKWVDGSDLQYKAWDQGAPTSNMEDNCVLLLASRGYRYWSNALCTRRVQYLCKFKL